MSFRSAFLAATLSCAALVVAPASPARAQSAAEHVALGDRDRAADPASALRHYEAAAAADPNNYDALWKASVSAVDLGEGTPDAERRKALYRQGEQYARR